MKEAFVVVDLGFGDAGKGSIVDFLVREMDAHTVVRFCGGAQAAHNVVEANGRHHTFASFGSGTLVPRTRTYLSKYAMIDPLSMISEERHLQSIGVDDTFLRATIHEGALVTTPVHVAANRLREIYRSRGRHGSCGMGVGETMSSFLGWGRKVLFASDLPYQDTVAEKIAFLQELKQKELAAILDCLPDSGLVSYEKRVLFDRDLPQICACLYNDFARRLQIVGDKFEYDMLAKGEAIVFEGAQGVLIDEWYGFHPFTTWSTTTFKNAELILAWPRYDGKVVKLGALRTYSVRHGPGPFPTEAAQLKDMLPEKHNVANGWQREFRVGYLDLVLSRYALHVCSGVDGLAMTFCDYLARLPEWKVCIGYAFEGDMEEGGSFFEFRDGLVVNLKVVTPPDLVYQERLGQLLNLCRPVYASLPKGREETFISFVSDQLGVPVLLLSHGPTANEKQYFG